MAVVREFATRALGTMASSITNHEQPSRNDIHTEKASRPLLEGLPPEIKVEILRQSADTNTLRNLVHASYRYYQAYRLVCQTIFSEVLLRQLNTRGYDVEGIAFFENFKSEFILGGARKGVSEIEACYQYACDKGYGRPSIKHALVVPVLTSVSERTVTWDGDSQTTYQRCNQRGFRSKDDINRALGWLIQEAFYDGRAQSFAPAGVYKALEVKLHAKSGTNPPSERRPLSPHAADTSVQWPSSSELKRLNKGRCRAVRYILLRPYQVPKPPSGKIDWQESPSGAFGAQIGHGT